MVYQRRRSLLLGTRLLAPGMLSLALTMLGSYGTIGDLVFSTQPVSTAKNDADVSSHTVEAVPGFGRASISKKGSLLYFPHV